MYFYCKRGHQHDIRKVSQLIFPWSEEDTGEECLKINSSGSRIWSGGKAKNFSRDFADRSEVESGKQIEPILAGVKGPP